ncbi:hypothetical protein [Streptomyces physcomitrii]|uniref:hypothetical protein n=1 Tax=Streptomyces physcomitrii TaxID=2724184 RepID=UPI001B2FE8EF|nr:hypothetical protein [Streptomyces physcomitrii]
MSKRQIRTMFALMASGEPVELTSAMASVKKLARLAFLAEQFGYQYADVRTGGGRDTSLKMLIVPDMTPQGRERAGRSWAQYPQAGNDGALPPSEPAALELLKARLNFDLTGKSAEKRMMFAALGVTGGCVIGAVQAGGDVAPFVVGMWVLLMALLGIGFFVNRKRNAKFAARLRDAGFTAVTDESGRLRYLPPGGQLPGHGNPFAGAADPAGGNPFAAAPQPTGNPFAQQPPPGPYGQPPQPAPGGPHAQPHPTTAYAQQAQAPAHFGAYAQPQPPASPQNPAGPYAPQPTGPYASYPADQPASYGGPQPAAQPAPGTQPTPEPQQTMALGIPVTPAHYQPQPPQPQAQPPQPYGYPQHQGQPQPYGNPQQFPQHQQTPQPHQPPQPQSSQPYPQHQPPHQPPPGTDHTMTFGTQHPDPHHLDPQHHPDPRQAAPQPPYSPPQPQPQPQPQAQPPQA